jgi:hypothetical protein
MSYRSFLQKLKTLTGDPEVTTYSIRRTVFELMRLRVKNIEEMAQVTLHANKDQLRWYLEYPLPDESRIQIKATSWHADGSGPGWAGQLAAHCTNRN